VLRNLSLLADEVEKFVQVLRRNADGDISSGDNTAVSLVTLDESISH